MTSELEDLLTAARDAEPGERIELRDAVAAHGDRAIDAMADWLSDRRLAQFAIRVLERIGAEPKHRAAVVESVRAADRTEWAPYLTEDADATLAKLGYRLPSPRSASSRRHVGRPPGLPGHPGRGYWVMRTSPWERPYLWAEAREGRLRQGWGVADEQNLNVIAETLRRGQLSGLQLEARRALRMLSSWQGGMHLGDIVVAPNLPDYGRLSVFRVAGSYEWAPAPALTWGERFGHVLPVELIEADIGRWEAIVTEGLRSILRVQTRLYNISGYGGDVERLIGGEVPVDRRGDSWLESEYEILFGHFPPQGAPPSTNEADGLSVELGRTPGAISAQWQDAMSYLEGRPASAASDPLKSWLGNRDVQGDTCAHAT